MLDSLPISLVIPTYRRDDILVATIRHLLDLDPKPAEILVLDQTEKHQPIVESTLRDWDATGAIRLISPRRAVDTSRDESRLVRSQAGFCPVC